MLNPLCKSKNQIEIYIDLENSHAATHIKKHPELLEYAIKIIQNHKVTKNEDRFETDMGFTVGTMDLIETTDTDEIIYAKRENREKFNRFVKNKESVPTNTITLDIKKNDQGKYIVHTVYIGKNTPKSPGGKKEDPNSRKFWDRHALVWGSQKTVPESETAECPW